MTPTTPSGAGGLTHSDIQTWREYIIAPYLDSAEEENIAELNALCDLALLGLRAAGEERRIVNRRQFDDAGLMTAQNRGHRKAESDRRTAAPTASAPEPVALSSQLLDLHRRWVGLLDDLKLGDQFDGDFDILVECASVLRATAHGERQATSATEAAVHRFHQPCQQHRGQPYMTTAYAHTAIGVCMICELAAASPAKQPKGEE